MLGIDSREGSKEDCENFLNEIKSMEYEIVSYAIIPIEDRWMITVSYNKEE